MRKILVLLAGAAVLLAMLTPAEAATRKYAISFGSYTPSGTAGTYNDTALDLSQIDNSGRDETIIKGKVTGGPVTGKKVYIFATNTNRVGAARTSLGSYTMSSSGYFARRFSPGDGNGGVYKIEIVKYAGSGYTGYTKTFYIRAYEFVDMKYFYDDAASNPADPPLVARNPDSDPDYGVGPTDPGNYWGTSYRIRGTGRAVFDFRGYTCLQFNLKLGVWKDSPDDPQTDPSGPEPEYTGTYTVKVGSTTVMSGTRIRLLASGDRKYYVEPDKSTEGKKLLQDSSGRVTQLFTVSVTQSGDPTGSLLTYILGRPVVSCTYPTIGEAKPNA